MKWLFGQNYRIAKVSTFYLTVSEIIIPSLKVRGQFVYALIIELKGPKSSCLNGHDDVSVLIIELLRFLQGT